MTQYTLHCFAQSGNTYKPALMLNLCGLDWKPRFVDFFNGETRTPEYRAINEMGEAPVLIAGDRKLSQSGVILQFLADQTGKFGAQNDDEGYEILRWLLFDNHKLTSYIGTMRFMLEFAKTGETEIVAFLRGRVQNALKVLDTHLAQNRFAIGERVTIADISLCGYLFWPDEFGVTWDDYPNIGSWLKRIQAVDGWEHPYKLLPGHPLPSKGK